MSAPWNRPYECDSWDITTSCVGRTLFRRREKWKATARGFRDGEQHAVYLGILTDRVGYGSTREEAEADMRRIICRDVKAYEEFLGVRRFVTREFAADDICPC